MPELAVEWDPPLRYRPGARERLCGIQVFYDFPWLQLFPDQRTQFRHGRVLAETTRQRCPGGLTPALLLTRRRDVDQGFAQTDEHFYCVVNIDEYTTAEGDAATAYIANHLGVGLEEVQSLQELSQLGSPEEVQALLEQHLNIEQVIAWIREDDERLERLIEVLELTGGAATVEQALDSLAGLASLEDEDLQRLLEFTIRLTNRDQRTELIRGATSDPEGRGAASQVLHERVGERIADAHRDLAAYEALLETGATETAMQAFLTQHPLLFGLEYASISPQVRGPSGSMDFILERFDGYNDLVELKGPADKIIRSPKRKAGKGVPSPHKYSLSKPLAQALAQAMAYRDRLTRHPQAAEELYGIENPRNPVVLVILGCVGDLEDHQKLVLEELNRSLHRVQVLPYDVLALRTRAALEHIAEFLSLAPAADDAVDT